MFYLFEGKYASRRFLESVGRCEENCCFSNSEARTAIEGIGGMLAGELFWKPL